MQIKHDLVIDCDINGEHFALVFDVFEIGVLDKVNATLAKWVNDPALDFIIDDALDMQRAVLNSVLLMEGLKNAGGNRDH